MQHLPFIFSNEWKYRLQRHLAFWLFWAIFQGFLYSFVAANSTRGYFRSLPMSMTESFIFLFAHMFLAYSLIYFVIPRFLLKQKYWQTAAWTFAFFILTGYVSALLNFTIIDKLRVSYYGESYANSPFRPSTLGIQRSLLAGLRGGITIGGIAAAIKLMKYWYLKEQRNLQLQKENTESQLQLLKAQVHPHFMFNTLNNIYAYTQDTSPVASKLVTRLSDLLRFILYESNQPLVPLEKELKLIEDYIALEKVRYGNKLELDIQLPVDTNNFYIAPLLLLPLVENSFKHGASNLLDQPWISLHVNLVGKQLQVKLVNGKLNKPVSNSRQAGIGIENVRKRLELLYPGRHEFTITNDEEVFIVNLKVELEQIAEADLKKPQPSLSYA